jgi:hypothetical protein
LREEQSDEAIHIGYAALWIASRSLSSGAHSRDPLARNDGGEALLADAFSVTTTQFPVFGCFRFPL